MADGSHGDRAGPKQLNNLTFSAPVLGLCDSKKFGDETFNGDSVKLSFYRELNQSESCENSDNDGVATRGFAGDSQKLPDENTTAVDGDDRRKRCIDRYDSSESSDSGVAVHSPSESGGSGSDITEPRSPRSPESSCSSGAEEASGGAGGGARMPPWASEPAPPAAQRIAVQPAPVRRHNPPSHRRITEFFNHKMKPQNGLKRDHNTIVQDDNKKKCPKNGVTHDLEKYISYLSQTLSPKVLMDVGRQKETASMKPSNLTFNGTSDTKVDFSKTPSSTIVNGAGDYAKFRENKERVHKTMNGFMEVRNGLESFAKDKSTGGLQNGFIESKKKISEKRIPDPSANGVNKVSTSVPKGKVPIPALPVPTLNRSPIKLAAKPDNRMNGVVSSTTKLDSRMNGVMCGSNNLSLNPVAHKMIPTKKDLTSKKTVDSQAAKRTNRKSSACIANSKNLTWSRANNLKQKCMNTNQRPSPATVKPGEANCATKMNIPNGVRQVPMAVNGNLSNINLPVNNLQNCHQINIPQACNGTTTNMTSFVAVPQNVMLTTLRIPQTGLQAQTLGQQNNMSAFNRQNVNVPSPTKLNGQFVFPLMQNINGTVVQIPNLMAKMPNFVLPQNPQLAAQRQDHLQNQTTTTTQILINGTLLKLASAMPGPSYSNVNKSTPMNTQQGINKNVSGVPTVGMTVQQKPNYAVNFSHPVLVPQPGFIVTSVPNMNVKETWSYTGSTASSMQSSCSNQMFTSSAATSIQTSCSNQNYPVSNATSIQSSSCSNQIHPAKSTQSSCSNQIYTAASLQSSYSNQILHHAPSIVSYTNQSIHTSSIPIAPVKPPDNPIQGTEPPSSTVKEPDVCEATTTKCDIPWLSKTFNNNIVPLITSKKRRFAEVSSSYPDKFDELLSEKEVDEIEDDLKMDDDSDESRTDLEDAKLRKVEEVARREDTIFTQITVLNDVSSNVHSSLIEANFGNESESGIGTDKSIDSPSDSLASKEGDDDSSLSLSISLCSVETQSQKSPILKQPKTLRFPPRVLVKADSGKRASTSDTSTTITVCLWENCKKEFDGDPDLLEHIQSTHVETQAGKENYVCLWERCKVFGKPSCSRLWLERHTLSHGGSKPFKCIVDGCERRFSTQTLLERHVNNHFNESSPNANGSKKSADSASKLIRRNGKKLRYRRQPWSARMFDFFDLGMMEGLAWRLARCTRWRLGGGCLFADPPRSRHLITLHASLAATRYNTQTSRREALLTYYPPHVVEDEWVPEKEVQRVKRVEIASLPAHAKVILYEQFCDSYRKPISLPSECPPSSPAGPPTPPPTAPTRRLPARHCTSSRLLNNLIAKQRKSAERNECNAPLGPVIFKEEERSERGDVSGAKKRKLGRRYGGNAFWPCGR